MRNLLSDLINCGTLTGHNRELLEVNLERFLAEHKDVLYKDGMISSNVVIDDGLFSMSHPEIEIAVRKCWVEDHYLEDLNNRDTLYLMSTRYCSDVNDSLKDKMCTVLKTMCTINKSYKRVRRIVLVCLLDPKATCRCVTLCKYINGEWVCGKLK